MPDHQEPSSPTGTTTPISTVSTIPIVSDSTFPRRWGELTHHLKEWYEAPDIEALRIILCIYISHFYYNDSPVWLMILGPPGSGKTEIGINPLSQFNNVVIPVTTLSDTSFLSGYGKGNGLLDQLKGKMGNGSTHGIFTFPDLTTTLITEDDQTRDKIIGAMRRIYDGSYERKVGNTGKQLSWKGKVTCIGACTPDVEDKWLLSQELGERWIKLRWRTHNKIDKYAEKAMSHLGQELEIRSNLNECFKNIILESGDGAEVEKFKPFYKILIGLAGLIEKCRPNVKRENKGSGRLSVTGLGNKQMTTRIAKNLINVVRASTALRQSTEISMEDIRLAGRLALDNIPSKRYEIIRFLISQHPRKLTKQEIFTNCSMAKATFYRVVEDLIHLDIIDDTESLHRILDNTYNTINLELQNDNVHKSQQVTLTESFLNVLYGAGIVRKPPSMVVSPTTPT